MRMNTTDDINSAAQAKRISTQQTQTLHVPMGAGVQPNWESKSDWDAFEFLAQKFSDLARKHLPRPVKDVVLTPLMHDSPGEITQPALNGIEDWKKGQCEAIPGVTMPNITIITRDYVNLYNRHGSLGPLQRGKYGFHGIMMDGKKNYEQYMGNEHIRKNEFMRCHIAVMRREYNA